jgi:hypothetical protein
VASTIALLQHRDHLFDRLVDGKPYRDRASGARRWEAGTGRVQTELQPIANVDAGPMIAGPEGQAQAQGLGVERHRSIHVRHVDGRVATPDHRSSIPPIHLQVTSQHVKASGADRSARSVCAGAGR